MRVIMPGKVYRNEAISARSYCMFHQVEGLCVDRGVTFSDLKGTLIAFIKQFYGSDLKYRFRPTFFPVHGAERRHLHQLLHLRRQGVPPVQADRVARDPRVRHGGPERLPRRRVRSREVYTGYAFGMGIDRVAMLRYGIDDIRLFFENDVRFLNQF